MSTRRKIFWVSFAFVIFIFAGGLFMSMQRSRRETAAPPLRAPSTPTEQAEDMEWEIFSDPRLGISFSYPKGWDLTSHTTATTPGVIFQSPETAQKVRNHEIDSYDLDFIVETWSDINEKEKYSGSWIGKRVYKDLDDFFSDENSFEERLVGTTTVDGLPAYKVLIGGNGQFFSVFVEHDRLYEFGFVTAWDESYLTPDQQRILSSIRFLR
jgi:hypothetical protein